MKEFFIHAGFHKTGTTSIQRSLCLLRDDLAKAGIQYPDAGIPRERTSGSSLDCEKQFNGHHLLAWSVIDHTHVSPWLLRKYAYQRSRDLWTLLQEEVENSGASTVLISSEDFAWIDRAGASKVISSLSPNEVVPVIYVRNPISYLISFYKELVRTGLCSQTFSQFTRENYRLCYYSERIRPWIEAGASRLKVRVYEKAMEEGGILRDFLNQVGGEDIELPESVRGLSLVSPSGTAATVMAYTNRILKGRLSERKIELINRRLISPLLPRSMPFAPGSKLLPQRQDDGVFDTTSLRATIRRAVDEFCETYIDPDERQYLAV